MAMEMKPPSKRLRKHAAPAVMIILCLMALPAVIFSQYNAGGLSAEVAVAKGLVTPVLYVKPGRGATAKITFNKPATNLVSPNAGSQMPEGLTESGRIVQLSFDFQLLNNQ